MNDAEQPPAAARPTRLQFVEAGRGLAALAVVIFHANASAKQFGGPYWHWPAFLAHGVDFFFVLSGFVILHAHARDVGRPERLKPYMLKRAIRLLPALWIVAGGWALLRWAAGVDLDPAAVVGSLLPYPSLEPTVPPAVWTLRHEIVFYVLFAVLLLSLRVGVALFALWLCLIVAQTAAALSGRPVTGIPAFFVAGYSAQFMLGMAVYLAHRRRPASPSAVPLCFGLLLTVMISIALGRAGLSRESLHDYHSTAATWGALALGVGFAAVLYGLVRLEGCVKGPPRGLIALGGCSYALYLAHTPANSLSQIVARHLPPWLKAAGGGHLLLIAVGMLTGWLLHRYWERPVIAALRRATGLSPPKRPALDDRAALPPDWQSTALTQLR